MLTVIDEAEYEISKNGKKYKRWLCRCNCGNEVSVRQRNLTGKYKRISCGCQRIERSKERKRHNEYDLSGEYGIGYTYNTNQKFLFDLEDYPKIKDISWKEAHNGYIVGFKNGEKVSMHRTILGLTNPKDIVDHKEHNLWDNRKEKLRVTNTKNNTRNEKLAINNTSGVTGVSYEENVNKWHSYIWVDGKTIHLGRFVKFDDAVKARIDAENKYFGEFSIHNSMKEVVNE